MLNISKNSLTRPNLTGLALLAHFPGISVKKYKEILRHCDSIESFFISPHKIIEKTNWRTKTKKAFIEWHNNLSKKQITNNLECDNIRVVTIKDIDYPTLLKQIYDPPLALFVRGELKYSNKSVAVVGSRKNTSYGSLVTKQIVSTLTQAGLPIISGLARGIDATAHEACLDAGGYTIAVLGGGIDKNSISPQSNYWLAEKIIASGGAIVSEYPPGTEPLAYHFPMRNRIIAGLSDMVIVTEAAKKSGSLITAQYGLDNSREIGTVPQNITNISSEGTNKLIKEGAHLITSAQDIFEILDIKPSKKQKKSQLDPLETKILEYLDEGCQTADELLTLSTVPAHKLLATLQLMELKGIIMIEGMYIYRK